MTLPDYPRPRLSARTEPDDAADELDTLSEEIAEAARVAGLTDVPWLAPGPTSSRLPAERLTRPSAPRARR